MKANIMIGDCRDTLKTLPDQSVHCAITSPPYWGLRSYKGDSGMIGLEPTFDEHVQNLLQVFDEVWRVLRDDGVLWLNYGDAYVGSWGNYQPTGQGGQRPINPGWTRREREVPESVTLRPPSTKPGAFHLPAKNLMMMPARVAIAMQENGWYLRSEIVWHKVNPMPESVTDRPVSSHEKIYLFSKKPRYFYDHVAVRTPMKESTKKRMNQKTFDLQTGGDKDAKTGNRSHRKVRENLKRRQPGGWASSENYHGTDPRWKDRSEKQRGHSRRHAGFNDRWDAMTREEQQAGGANLRNVWTMATSRYKGAHYATFPEELVETCIKAGTSEKGCCAACGAPFARQTRKELVPTEKAAKTQVIGERDHAADKNSASANRQKDGHIGGYRNQYETTGWCATCECDAGVSPCVVLDPFGGSGTVAAVATRMDRDAVLCEISEDYAVMSADRIREGDLPLFKTEIEFHEG